MKTVAIKVAAGIPLPACVASVWGGFLVEGLFAVGATEDRQHAVLQAWGQGCIELVIAASLHMPEVWRQICHQWEKNDVDFAGVFEYEVVSPLGQYLGDYLLTHGGQLPEPEAVKAEIARMISAFFTQDAPPQVPDLATVASG